ncbi:MAG: bifunctional riboflavin kinase/FAD synthetase [Deltaproteobacteria bacterium]|nr:bifunctional riboflavin kinase/FAD synthetase [Deltaproteobacteria bacterium]
MKTFYGSKSASRKIKRPVVALGNFDGIHLAHQNMFRITVDLAKKLRGTPIAYSFDPHPVKVLSAQSAPALISTLEQKVEWMKRCQLKALILEPFSLAFAKYSPEDFFKEILIKRLKVSGVVAGYDFTFGAKRAGNSKILQELCEKHHITCQIMEVFLLKDTLVSSTQVRQLIREGNIERASDLLGRPFEVVGTVIHGEELGRKLGFPTANLLVENELIPPPGVYATQLKTKKSTSFLGLTNIGYRPTVGGKRLTIETHLLHFKQNIYGKKVRLRFLKKIREEKNFGSIDDLIYQIRQDILIAESFFKNQ